MTIMTSAQFADLVEPVLNKAFDGRYKQATPEWSAVFKTKEGNKRRFHEVPMMFGLAAAPEKPEGTSILEDAGGIAYRTRLVYKTYAISSSLTEELVEDAEAISMGSWIAQAMAMAMVETKEIVHADIFNRAETAGYELGDGVTMLSTAHPLAGGGTFANTLAAGADMSEASLEELLILMMDSVDERGNNIRLRANQVVVPNENAFVAERLLASTQQPGTANNDVNAIRSMGVLPSKPTIMTRVVLDDSYFLITDAEHGFCHIPRVPISRKMEGEFRTGNQRYKSRERYVGALIDPRGVFGDLGI